MEAHELVEEFQRINAEEKETRERLERAQEEVNGKPHKFDPFSVDGSFDPGAIERRDWLSVGLLLRQHVTLLISPGGVGKSTLSMLIAVAVALGRRDMIPGRDVSEAGNVLVLNSEDDMGEMKRRLAGILQGHKIDAADLTGKLHIESLYGRGGLLASNFSLGDNVREGELFAPLIRFCVEKNIKLIVIDPLVGFHDVTENDNGDMEKVAMILRRVARWTGAAVLTVHHTRKAQGSESHAGDMDAGRGASALSAAARIAITLAQMGKDTAKKLNIDWKVAKHLRRIDDAKQNYAPAAEDVSWFEMRDTKIANGERVGVPVEFDMTGIAERAAKEKEREKAEANILQRTTTAQIVVGDKTEGSSPQPGIISRYKQATELKNSAAQKHIKDLPIGKDEAFRFFSKNRKDLMIWRNQVGTDAQPRYTIEWGIYSEDLA